MGAFLKFRFWRDLPRGSLIWLKNLPLRLISKLSSWNKRFQLKVGRYVAWFLLYPIILTITVIAVPLFWYLYWDRTDMPDISEFLRGGPTTGQIYDTNGEVIIELAKEYRQIAPFEKYPKHVINAMLAAEDTRFFRYWLNHGVDYIAIGRAFGMNLGYTIITSIPKGKLDLVLAEGASTITQQAVRLYFLSEITKKENRNQLIHNNFVTRILAKVLEVKEVNKFSRKIIEAKYAIWLESEMARIYGSREEAKKKIFELFTPYMANGRYGFEAASEYYFGKHIWELGYEETEKAALLAGMIKNPALYMPKSGEESGDHKVQLERRNKILDRMANNGYISEEDAERFKEKAITILERDNDIKTIAPTVVSDSLREIRTKGFKFEDFIEGNIQIRSTVDLRIQKIVNESLEKGLEAYEKRHPDQKGLIQGSVIVLRNRDAAILAMAGGREYYQGKRYKYSDLNRVRRARQAGSAFKPFVYLTAFMQGWTPEKTILDAPVKIPMGYGRGSHPVHNYDGKFLGNISLCEALYRSRNAPTVRLVLYHLGTGSFENSGMKKVIDTAKILGIQSPFHNDIDHLGRIVYYPTSALGASEVNVLELANAYRAMASGLSAEPYIIKEIVDRDGDYLFTKQNEEYPLPIDKEALEMIQSCLRKVVTQPGGTAYSLTVQKFPVPVMGKTGTTNDFRNALFAGSTYGPDGITVVVRIDFDDNRQLAPKETGAMAALPIFKDIVQKIYKQNLVGPAPEFPEKIENPAYGRK